MLTVVLPRCFSRQPRSIVCAWAFTTLLVDSLRNATIDNEQKSNGLTTSGCAVERETMGNTHDGCFGHIVLGAVSFWCDT